MAYAGTGKTYSKGKARRVKRRRRRAYKRIDRQEKYDNSIKSAAKKVGVLDGREPQVNNHTDEAFRAKTMMIGHEDRAKQRKADRSYLDRGGDPRDQKKRFRRYKSRY